MNFKNKLQKLFFLLLIIIPFNVFAYSDYVIPGGETIGIEINSKNVIVVGFYDVSGKSIAVNAGFNIGDQIEKVNNLRVESIEDMIKKINESISNDTVTFTVKRNNIEKNIDLKLIKDRNDIYKTGLYVKDKITGVGTLTYIDPETKIYGALGHEILESSSKIKVEVKNGKIFKSSVTGINKSDSNTTGEKKAKFNSEMVFGSIKENTKSGIFGKYLETFNEKNLLKVGSVDDIVLGSAIIRTVLDKDKVKEYSINILKLNKESDSKNILFEITDKDLINKTNGIIKGMSGSPIIQNNMIIGAVTHAIVNDNNKGYGIFITTMLKEGDN